MLSLPYPQILQTITTVTGLVSTGCGVFATILAHRAHATLNDVHQTLKDRKGEETDGPTA